MKRKPARRVSAAEETFALQIKGLKLPPVVREHMFATEDLGRRWRFDVSWKEYWCAVEIEGLVIRRGKTGQTMGRHTSLEGFEGDAIKYAWAAVLGWTVLRFNQRLVNNGTAIDLTRRLLLARGWQP